MIEDGPTHEEALAVLGEYSEQQVAEALSAVLLTPAWPEVTEGAATDAPGAPGDKPLIAASSGRTKFATVGRQKDRRTEGRPDTPGSTALLLPDRKNNCSASVKVDVAEAAQSDRQYEVAQRRLDVPRSCT